MQIVVVTGASSGIGRAAAVRFGRDGAAVLAVGRKAAALDEVAHEVERAGGRCRPFEADVTRRRRPTRSWPRRSRAFGGLTTLVNAAGIIATGTVETPPTRRGTRCSTSICARRSALMRAAAPHLGRASTAARW